MTIRLIALGILTAAFASPTAGQVVLGHVTAETTGEPLGGVAVTLLLESSGSVRRTITDEEGLYELRAPAAGEYRVVADHLGYRRLESPLMEVGADRTISIDFELPIDPVEVEGIEVEVERREELQRRLAQYGVTPELLGGRLVPRSEMEKRPTALNVGEVLQWQNLAGIRVSYADAPPALCVRVARGRDGCALTVLDGVLVSEEFAASILPEHLEAVAILRPTEATLSYGTIGSVGAILLFTRNGVAR